MSIDMTIPEDLKLDFTPDPDTCACDDSLTARIVHNNWGVILCYECLSCGARWHYHVKSTIGEEKYRFAEGLVAQRRKHL